MSGLGLWQVVSDHFVQQQQFRTPVFLVYRQNVTSLQGHIWVAISTWVGLDPSERPTISAISILQILVSK